MAKDEDYSRTMARFFTFVLFALLSFLGLAPAARAGISSSDVYGFSFRTIDGSPFSLAQYQGKVILLVNTASRCGFTKQYAGLQALYDTYGERGLVVLGIPSNDFGGQEPGSAEEIKEFTDSCYHVTFPLMQKETVTGRDAHPFFIQARTDFGMFAAPRWNFYKYVIGRDGHIVAWFPSQTAPESPEVKKAIEEALTNRF